MTRSPAENQAQGEALTVAKLQQTVEAARRQVEDMLALEGYEPGSPVRGALRDLAAQASRTQEWKQLATDLGDALRQIEHLVNHEYRLKHHDLAFVFNTVTQVMDVGEVSALLARLHDLAAEQDAA